jgi:hypothetical protein
MVITSQQPIMSAKVIQSKRKASKKMKKRILTE